MTEREKVCRVCGESWPLDTEFYYRRTRSEDGYTSSCIACIVDYNRQRRVGKVWNNAERTYV